MSTKEANVAEMLNDAEREELFAQKKSRQDRILTRFHLLVAAVLFVFAAVFYYCFMVDFATIGEPADWVASISGAKETIIRKHLIWRSLILWTLGGNSLGMVSQANLFCTLISAAGVSLLYLVVAELLLRYLDLEHWALELGRPALKTHGTISFISGIAAALAMMFCSPYWTAATQVYFHSFYLAWLLLGFYLLLRYAARLSDWTLAAFTVIYGIGLSQTSCFVAFLPVCLAYLLWIIWSNGRNPSLRFTLSAGVIFALLLLFAWMGASAYAASPMTQLARPDDTAWVYFIDNIRDLLFGVTGSIPQAYWLVLLGVTIVPCLAALIVARRSLNGENDVALYVMHTVIAALSIFVLLDLRYSPWQIYGGESFQIIPYAMLCTAFGFSVAWCGSHFLIVDRKKTAYVAAALPLILVAFTAFRNAEQASPSKQAFARRYAADTLRDINGRKWFFTEGILADNIRIQAVEQQSHVDILLPWDDHDRLALLTRKQKLPSVRLRNLAEVSSLSVVREWIPNRDDAGDNLALGIGQDLWYSGAYEPEMHGVAFLGRPETAPALGIDVHRESLRDAMSRLDAYQPELNAATNALLGSVRQAESVVRHKLALYANNSASALLVDAEPMWKDGFDKFNRANRGDLEGLDEEQRNALYEEGASALAEALSIYAEAQPAFERIHDFSSKHIPCLLNFVQINVRARNVLALIERRRELIPDGATPALVSSLEKAAAQFSSPEKDAAADAYYAEALAIVKDDSRAAERAALQGDIFNSEMFILRGLMWARSGDSRATKAMLKAGGFNGMSNLGAPFASLLAKEFIKFNNLEEADLAYKTILENDPANPEALAGLGNIALLRGDAVQASEFISQAKKAGLPESKALPMETMAALQDGRIETAVKAASSFADMSPNDSSAQFLLATTLFAAWNDAATDVAKTAFLKRLSATADRVAKLLSEEDATTLRVRTWVAMAEARYDDARTSLESMLRATTKDEVTGKERISIEGQARLHIYTELMELDLYRLQDMQNARRHAREALSISADHSFGNYVLGSEKLENEDWEEAQDFLSVALRDASGFVRIATLNDLAVAEVALGNASRSEELAQETVDEMPNNYIFWDTLGYAKLQQGRAQEAEADFKRSIDISGLDNRVVLHLAMAKFANGDKDEARKLVADFRVTDFTGLEARDLRTLRRNLDLDK